MHLRISYFLVFLLHFILFVLFRFRDIFPVDDKHLQGCRVLMYFVPKGRSGPFAPQALGTPVAAAAASGADAGRRP